MTGAIRIPIRMVVTVLCAALLVATPALGQATLERVDELTRLGRANEARNLLLEWWEGDRATASRRDLQRGLWLRGRLTVDPVQAELDFQRLVVLYPSGQFTPDAILRLAQGAYARGNEDVARRYVETLQRDYPRSDVRERADGWLADAGPVPAEGDTPISNADEAPGQAADVAPVTGAVVIDPTTDPSADPVVERATDPVAERATDPAADPTTDPPTDPTTDPETESASVASSDRASDADASPSSALSASGLPMNYCVQLGAFADRERALALFDEVRAAGVDARIVLVEGSKFTHVRAGRFVQREQAVILLDELTAGGLNAALVRDDRPELPFSR